MSGRLTAAEAAARLGVKKETLYAYVSRGLLGRSREEGSRLSFFDAVEVDQFRSRRRRSAEGELAAVISTGITRVEDGRFRIRGRDPVQFVESGASFEDAVDLVWEVEDEQPWGIEDDVLAGVRRVAEAMPPGAPLIDRLRATVAVASAMDPLRLDPSPPGVIRAGRTLLLAMVSGIPARGRAPSKESSVARLLWPRLTRRRARGDRVRALDVALALLVDHGLASSTFAARIASSVRADPYSVVSAGLGVLGGPFHGAASGEVHRLLSRARDAGEPGSAIAEIQRSATATVPGFGHTVYRREDPRFVALMATIRSAWADDSRLATVTEVEALVRNRTEAPANVDFALGALTWLAGMDAGAGEAVFAVARTAGWIAHGVEERLERPLRFRPRARYVGPRG